MSVGGDLDIGGLQGSLLTLEDVGLGGRGDRRTGGRL